MSPENIPPYSPAQLQERMAQKNRRAGVIVLSVVALMLGLSFASVPLYRLYCQVTGYGGQAYQSNAAEGKILARQMTVRFNTDTSPNLPWDFKSDQEPLALNIGQEAAISFTAINQGDKPNAGTALYNVSPPAAGKYFHKTQCFCFDYQLIAPNQTAHFPVVFYIDPAIADDPQLDDLKTITLSYAFFVAESDELDKALEAFYKGENSGKTSIPMMR